MNSPQLFEVVASALVFQFVPPDRDSESVERVPSYYDKLNSWLGQILQRDIDNVQIELCEIEQHGVAIRICPIESPEKPPSSEDIDNLVACLEQQIDILVATVQHADTFVKLVSENDSLHLVEMPGWAGLGGVRYAPSTWVNVMTDQAKEELNRLNTQLVETLRNTDAAFSLGEGADGLACVRFGMVTQDTGKDDFINSKFNSNLYHYKLNFPSTSKQKYNSKFQEFETVRMFKTQKNDQIWTKKHYPKIDNHERNQQKKEERKKKATFQNPFLLFLSFVLFCLYLPQLST